MRVRQAGIVALDRLRAGCGLGTGRFVALLRGRFREASDGAALVVLEHLRGRLWPALDLLGAAGRGCEAMLEGAVADRALEGEHICRAHQSGAGGEGGKRTARPAGDIVRGERPLGPECVRCPPASKLVAVGTGALTVGPGQGHPSGRSSAAEHSIPVVHMCNTRGNVETFAGKTARHTETSPTRDDVPTARDATPATAPLPGSTPAHQ